MDVVNLPTENACEPEEDAQQPKDENQFLGINSKQAKQNVTFTENARNRMYNVLSQPPKDVTHKQKLIWLQQRRTGGLWAQCDDCDIWRYLPQVLDSHELQTKWYCWMNPDKSLATCSAPEVPICLREEEDLIHAEYAAGSVVLARMPGFPWWPAMVDDCPDTEQYYWLDGFCDIPTYYNVVFFDAHDVSRAWIAPENLMPYKDKKLKKSVKIGKYKKRLDEAILQADDAIKLTLSDRLAKYSFIARYNGKILSPAKIKKRDIQKYQNKLKRKFNVEILAELSDSTDDEDDRAERTQTKRINVYTKTVPKINPNSCKSKKLLLTGNTTENLTNTSNDINSLTVQIGNDSELIEHIPNTAVNKFVEQKTNVTIDMSETEDSLENGQKSDDFDF